MSTKRTQVRIDLPLEDKLYLKRFGYSAQQAVGRILLAGLISRARAAGLSSAADRERLIELAARQD